MKRSVPPVKKIPTFFWKFSLFGPKKLLLPKMILNMFRTLINHFKRKNLPYENLGFFLQNRGRNCPFPRRARSARRERLLLSAVLVEAERSDRAAKRPGRGAKLLTEFVVVKFEMKLCTSVRMCVRPRHNFCSTR